MEQQVQRRTLGQIAQALGGQVVGNPETSIARPVPAGSNDPEGLTFAGDDKYLAKALASTVGAIIAKTGADLHDRPGILVDQPRRAFGMFLAMSARPLESTPGTHPTAVISPSAQVAEGSSIGAYAVIESGAEIGAQCVVMPFAYVGPGCRLGQGTVVMPHAVLVQDVRLGSRCLVHSGAVLGADGFGFVWDGTKQQKVPQVGGVVVGDDVEIGANSCIDRATCGDTVIGDGSKFDDMVMVAHNVTVGKHTVMAASAAIAGSSVLGDRVSIGGQAALSDHVTVADDVTLAGRTGVMSNVTEPGVYLGTPALPIKTTMRNMALIRKLPEILQRVRDLEAELKRLQG